MRNNAHFPLLPTSAASASAASAPALRLFVATKLTGISEFTPESNVTTLIPREFAVSTNGASALASNATSNSPLGFAPSRFQLAESARQSEFHPPGQHSWFYRPTLCCCFRPHFTVCQNSCWKPLLTTGRFISLANTLDVIQASRDNA